jgi:hypothetical protein
MWIERNDIPIGRSRQRDTRHIIRVSVLHPKIRGVNVVKGVGVENPQLISVIPLILVHQHINIKIKRPNNVTENRQYYKVLQYLVRQKRVEGLYDVFLDQ